MDSFNGILNDAGHEMDKALDHIKHEFSRIIAGKASATMVDEIRVHSYGALVPINQVASVNTTDAVTIVIKPWDKSLIIEIEKAILNSKLGFNPRSDGSTVFISIPSLTEERRLQLGKAASSVAENGKVAIRTIRKKFKESIKLLEDDGASEDDMKKLETKLQELTDSHINKVDKMLEGKIKELSTI
jgi:ribosome recycling factor